MVPFNAPIFMLPLAGMMFLAGMVVHQIAGWFAVEKGAVAEWAALSAIATALQIGAFVMLISA
jgi:hypothetical protein